MAELPNNPSVLVLLVATNGAQWLPDVIRGLRAQRYRKMSVICVDNASTDGSGDLLAEAFDAKNVVVLERHAGYGRALAAGLKVAAERFRTPADAFLLLHDDAELAPKALEAMFEALAADGTGIVGAKLVEWNDPTMLQDIGQTSDRYGRGVPRVERGELDQGQHDGVHEVLYATSAALLVSREVVETIGLFDLRYVAMRDDFDFCWRARLAGFRTVVTTDAIARHVSAVARGIRHGPTARRTRYFADRNVIATLIKNYGGARLALTLPVTLLVSLMNIVLFILSGKRGTAFQALEALQWNIVHLPSSLRARHRAQRARKVRDAEITSLMHHGATRLRAQFERAVERVVGEVDEGPDDEGRTSRVTLVEHLRRHPTATMLLVAGFIGIIGARTMFFSGPLAGADLPPFPANAGAFFTEFLSGWRGTGAGGAAPATPGLVLLGIFSFLCFGSAWLAQRLLVLGLPVVGAVGAFRLARTLGLGSGARRVAAIVYLVSPIVLGSLAEGRLGDLVLLAAAPAIVSCLLRAAGVAPGGWRSLGMGIIVIAMAGSLAPWTFAFAAGTAILVGFAVRDRDRNYIARAAAMIGVALALLFPWSFELFREGSPIGAGGVVAGVSMRELLGLTPGPIRPLPEWLWYGSVAAVLAALFLPVQVRPRRSGLFAVLAVAGVFIAWFVARGVPWIAPRPSLPLVAAAVAVAILAAMAFEGAGPLLSVQQFGARHLAMGFAGALVVLQIAAGAVWVGSGRHPGIDHGDDIIPTFLPAEARQYGEFRIAWVGGDRGAPAIALSGPEGGNMLRYLTRPAGAGHDAFRTVIGAIAAGRTRSGGKLLAPFGVRYVIARPDTDPVLLEALERQVDFEFLQRFGRSDDISILWINQASLPVAAFGSAGARSPLFLSTSSGRDGLRRSGPASFEGVTPKGTTTILLAEDHSSRWRAVTTPRAAPRPTPKAPPAKGKKTTAKKTAPPDARAPVKLGPAKTSVGKPSLGWATALPVGPGDVTIRWRGNFWHRVAIAFQAFLILMFIGEWSRRAARERGER